VSAVDAVREKYGNLRRGTDGTDKSPSVSSVSALDRDSEKFANPGHEFGDRYARGGDLPVGLEPRLRMMAHRWRYSADELAEVLALARMNPDGWLRAVSLDERREVPGAGGGASPSTRS
jgi:hypothetical protein